MEVLSVLASSRHHLDACRASVDYNYDPRSFLSTKLYLQLREGNAALRNIMTMVLRAFCSFVGTTQSAKMRAQASGRFEAEFDVKIDCTSRDSNICHAGN